MSQPWWRRLLPDTSQLWILFAVLAVIFFGVIFFNLAGQKAQVVARQRAAQQQLQILEEQNQRLREALGAAGSGANIETAARQYFGYGYPGESRIVVRPTAVTTSVPEPVPEVQPASDPFWVSVWRLLPHFDK